jgi:hypothetical protein
MVDTPGGIGFTSVGTEGTELLSCPIFPPPFLGALNMFSFGKGFQLLAKHKAVLAQSRRDAEEEL